MSDDQLVIFTIYSLLFKRKKFLQIGRSTPFVSLLEHTLLQHSRGEFICVGSDSLHRQYAGSICDGGFTIGFPQKTDDHLVNLLNNLTPENSVPHNPWFMEIWKRKNNCSYSVPRTHLNHCYNFENESTTFKYHN